MGGREVEQHSVVFCANVVYGVGEIEPFVRKLHDSASEIVAIVVYYDAPLSMMSPLWEAVHQERRINLPALPELLPVLWEMEIYPDVVTLPGATRPSAPSLDARDPVRAALSVHRAGIGEGHAAGAGGPRDGGADSGRRMDSARGECAAAGGRVVADGREMRVIDCSCACRTRRRSRGRSRG